MAEYRLEMQLLEWVPGSFEGFLQNFAQFVGQVINQLPVEYEFIEAWVENNVLKMRFEVQERGGASAVIAPIIVGLILGILFILGLLAGWIVWVNVQRDIVEFRVKDCDEQLREDLIDEDGYIRCLGAAQPQGAIDKLLVIGGGILLVGGGIWLFSMLKGKEGS